MAWIRSRAQPRCASQATYCRLIDKRDGWLDFSLTAREVDAHVRAFQPWPGALLDYQGTILRVGSARPAETPQALAAARPGALHVERSEIFARCGDDMSVRMESLQKPGGKMLSAAAFLNGFPIESGYGVEFPNRYPLVAEKPFRAPRER